VAVGLGNRLGRFTQVVKMAQLVRHARQGLSQGLRILSA
jgi:hypothetical protein